MPATGRFEFDAPSDGEYWFAVRTVDYQNQLHPEGEIVEAGLKVAVDTTPPTLDIQLSQPEPGKIQLRWNASDVNLDPATLRLESTQPGSGNWQPVSIIAQASGQTAWSIPEGGLIAVRGTISDKAENSGFAQNQLKITTSISRPTTVQPDFSQPVASNSAMTTNPFTPPAIQMESAGTGSYAARNEFVADSPAQRPEIVRDRYLPPSESVMPSLSDGRSRVVNTAKFQIGYQVEDIGPSGVSAVEFYITQDDGAKWWKYGNDRDRQTPFEVEVPSDGVYGFALRARSGAGLAADPPQSGEKPSIVVVVDQTPPVAQLLGAEQGHGAALDKIMIRWTANDQRLAETPVTLSYATDLHGPWEPISGSLANTGSYVWTVGAGVPTRLYIRLTVRDAAGNIARVDTPQPVVVDLSKPTARILDIVPAAQR
jgi:hypothetical protein